MFGFYRIGKNQAMAIKQIIECGKRCQIYFIGLKKDLFGCFRIEETRDKNNETDLKEGGGIEMSTTVLSIYAMHALFAINTYP